VETHGSYNPVAELSVNSNSNIAALKIAFDDASYTAVSIEEQSGRRRMFIVAADASTSQRHQLKIAGQVYRWSGPYYYTDVE
jgi:hypothetical protein